jgi:hypothetical protein
VFLFYTIHKKFSVLSLTIIIILLITVTTFASNNIRPAYAHITKQFGNITIEVGWSNEPSLAGELNNVIVDVNKTRSGGNSSAVINALADMNILVKYGGVTKTLDFEPSEQAEGLYESKIIPTRVGSYSLVLNGTIQGQNISSAEIPLDDVEGKQKLSFPDSSSSSGSEEGTSSSNNNNIGPKVSGAISQLATDIDSTKDSIDTLAKNNIDMQKSLQDIKNGADRSYMTGMVGIGAGAAGIVIAAVALSRR